MQRRLVMLAGLVTVALTGATAWRVTHPAPDFEPMVFGCLEEPMAGALSVKSSPIELRLEWSADGGRLGVGQKYGRVNWVEKPEREVRGLATSLLEPLTSGVSKSERDDFASVSLRVDCGARGATAWDGKSPIEPSVLNCRNAKLEQIVTCVRLAHLVRPDELDRRAAAIREALQRIVADGGTSWGATVEFDEGAAFDEGSF